ITLQITTAKILKDFGNLIITINLVFTFGTLLKDKDSSASPTQQHYSYNLKTSNIRETSYLQ
ncbi:14902_t:CDS:1, partial [Racocetra persica]